MVQYNALVVTSIVYGPQLQAFVVVHLSTSPVLLDEGKQPPNFLKIGDGKWPTTTQTYRPIENALHTRNFYIIPPGPIEHRQACALGGI